MSPEVRRALIAVFVARTGANGGLRIVYPFLPAIARGLGVPIGALASLVALRNLGGVTTPIVARAAEAWGRRRLMLAAMMSITVGCALSAGASSLMIAGVGIVLVGIAKPTFDVSMQSWFSDRVPYQERGRVFGITELTWSVALLATVPLSGLLIELTSWRAPFVLTAIFAAIGTVAIFLGISSDVPHHHVARPLEMTGPRARMLASVLLWSAAAEIPFIVYGRWLEEVFGLSVTGIGLFTVVVVVAELAGEGLVVATADRLGLKLMIYSGLAVSILAYLSFAAVGASLALALCVVSLWIVAFEVTIVATIPFVSELAVESRDRLLSLLSVAIALGRGGGAVVALALYESGGMTLAGLSSAGLAVLSGLLIVRIEDPQSREPSVSTK
ncbi:MAG: MFS transporter [Actinobacteria bacterium]|nr:MFS transporter [Actinomycetota bacterium]